MITYSNSYISETQPGYIQFENANEARSYPFESNSILQTLDGKILPDGLIADAHLALPVGVTAFLSKVYISTSLVSICIKVKDELTEELAALVLTLQRSKIKPYTPYRLDKLVGCEDIGGVISLGNVDLIDQVGDFRFEDSQVKFENSVISNFVPAKVRRIIDPRTGESLSGEVNIKFSNYINVSKKDGGIDLELTPEGNIELLPACDRNKDFNACGATPITNINGVYPDEQGRIVLWFH